MLAGNPAAGQLSAETAMSLFSAGYALISLGVVCTYVFIWSVFARDSRWGTALMIVGATGVVITGLPVNETREGTGDEAYYWVGQVVRIGSGVWGFVEATR